MNPVKRSSSYDARRIVVLALFLGVIVHGGLLPFTLNQTYDAHTHMFFGDHYYRSWFDLWEPRWYTGFTVTAYPPGSHQLIGLLLHFMPHAAAFIVVQVFAVLILVIGVYRFSRLWVSEMAAALAALLCVSSTAIAETVHIFGQLPTTLSLGIFLNATPHIYAWIKQGQKHNIPLALIMTAGATAAHHVTPIFATLFFVIPLGLHAWARALPEDCTVLKPSSWPELRQLLAAPLRGLVLGLMMLIVIIAVVYPYWHWSITDPITQVSIPHGSRESFLEHPNFGFIFFVIPWGPLLALIPYIVWCAFRTSRWPLAISVLICLLLGTGGTTPIPRLVFGPAYDIITLDRFTFWAVIMTLPFAGALAASLLSGRARAVLVAAFGKRTTQASIASLTLGYAFVGILVAALPLIKPTQPAALDPQPIVQFMAKDDHQRWRYMTLGFGDQFAYHSALIDALSVDGNYHSARRMPQLMAYSVERLENAKYLGESGLSSLRQVIINAETYNLKYIFSNDAFYDPLLYFAGWTRLVRLSNGVVVWNKPGVKPIAYPLPRQTLPMHKTIMWGTIPPASLFLVFLILLGLAVNNQLIPAKTTPPSPETKDEPNPKITWFVRHAGMTLVAVSLLTVAVLGLKPQSKADAEATLEQYYIDLDQRDFEAAYAKLDPNVRPDYSSYLKMMRNRGGLVWSYSKLTDLRTERQESSATNTQIDITRTYQTALGPREVTSSSNMVQTEDGWRINSQTIPKAFTHALMIRGTDATVRDLSTTRTGLRGTSAVSFDDPVITASEPVLTNFGDAIRVIGAVHNTSSFPACLNIVSTGRFDTDRLVAQRMGILGGHRLAPGETRHYSLEFEGRLQPLQDEPPLSSQPERFRLPGFSSNPEHVDVQISTFSCQQDTVSGIVMDDIHITRDNALQVTLTNYDTKIAGVTKLSLVYFDHDGRPVLIRPHYLETNLIPGEVKTELIPLSPSHPVEMIKHLTIPEINGALKDHAQHASQTHIKLDGNSSFSALSIEIDAMPFIPPQ